MVKELLNLRIEKEKKERLDSLAKCLGTTTNDLIRQKINVLINNDCDQETKGTVLKLIKELAVPFVFVKNSIGSTHAKKEREIREKIITELKEAFRI